MTKKEKIKKSCHSRVLLSGIFNACCGLLPLRKQPYVEDPRLQPSGMTPDFMKSSGFTLIELLVVVLIIGILAAIALPQYQAAVVKSRFVHAKILSSSVKNAQEIYYLANNRYATHFVELDVELPAGGELNETGDMITWNWGVCLLTTKAIVCTTTDLGYQAYYDHSRRPQRRVCVVQDVNNTIQHKICRNETGNESGTNGVSYEY